MTNTVPAPLRLNFMRKAVIGTLRSVPEQLYFTVRSRPLPSSSILLAGSGRSGTTWLADLLAAGGNMQHIFEPMHPYWIPEIRELTGWTRELFRMRLRYLRPDDAYPEWEAQLARMLSGRVRSWGWTDFRRSSHFPERYLIKAIRANLMLGYLYNTFHVPILYVLRHPCAVVLSRLQTKSYCRVGDLLAQEHLVEDHLRPWLSDIERVRDRLESLAIWWAVENLVAQRQLQTIPHLMLSYEDLILEPQAELDRIFTFLNLERHALDAQAIQMPSRTSRGAAYGSQEQRLANWQRKLSVPDQERILRWAHLLGVDCYDRQAAPVSMRRAEANGGNDDE